MYMDDAAAVALDQLRVVEAAGVRMASVEKESRLTSARVKQTRNLVERLRHHDQILVVGEGQPILSLKAPGESRQAPAPPEAKIQLPNWVRSRTQFAKRAKRTNQTTSTGTPATFGTPVGNLSIRLEDRAHHVNPRGRRANDHGQLASTPRQGRNV